MFNRHTSSGFISVIVLATVVSGCMSGSDSSTSSTSGVSQPASSIVGPPGAPPIMASRAYSTDVMVFNGAGAWQDEVTSLESILTTNGASYQEVNSAGLDAMSVDDIAKFGLMIFPGGAGGTEAAGISAATHANLREAVQVRGVSYLGFCAGAFIAVAPAPAAGQDVSYGVGVVAGPVLNYYTLENQGVTIAMTLESFPNGTTRDLIWYGGPVTPNTPNGVIAKYPTGDPAISEMWSGKGFVILSGPHPAAPQSTRDAFGLVDTDGLDFTLAWQLISAALNQTILPTF